MSHAILVHGGAGRWDRASQRFQDALIAVEAAAAAGRDVLRSNGTALDAAEAAVRSMEAAPSLNAGRGSVLTSAGTIEMDAMIMDGATLAAGAVAGVTRMLHPVSLARRVMTETPHVLVAAAGAEAFADSIGFPRCTDADLIIPREDPPPASDTVGAVAIDATGSLAVAVSTGGVRGKMPGRVGDSAIVGAGGYADNATAAVGATGDGEAFMKLLLSKRACDLIAAGATAQAACDAAIAEMAKRLPDARGGLIAIDRAGRPGVAFNSAAMPYAWARNGEEIIVDSIARPIT